MDFITGDIKQLYRKFLVASMASAVVMSIYSFVDTIAVGQSEGPVGAAAMAVITPLYGVLIFLGILCGVGGSVLYGNAHGEGKEEKANALFTAATGLMLFLMVLVWIMFALFHEPIFTFFGADTELMPKVMEYARWLIWFLPVFILPTFISSFIRNDGAPGLAMAAVIIGGCVNVFGDWFFCFPLGMGITGAAIATVLGTCIQVLIMCSHFLSKKCTLRFVKPNHIVPAIRQTLPPLPSAAARSGCRTESAEHRKIAFENLLSERGALLRMNRSIKKPESPSSKEIRVFMKKLLRKISKEIFPLRSKDVQNHRILQSSGPVQLIRCHIIAVSLIKDIFFSLYLIFKAAGYYITYLFVGMSMSRSHCVFFKGRLHSHHGSTPGQDTPGNARGRSGGYDLVIV